MLTIAVALWHAAAWYGLIARATQPKVREYWYLLWVAPCWVAAWFFRSSLGHPASTLCTSAVSGIVIRWINDFLRLHFGTDQMYYAGGSLKIAQNPGPVPETVAASWLPKAAGSHVMLCAGPDGYTWPEALSSLTARLKLAGALITETASQAEWTIDVYGFAGNISGYVISPGEASNGQIGSTVKKRFEPYALIFSRRRPEDDLARDAVYDLCQLISQAETSTHAASG